ncbi:phytoene desaturase family protein [Parvicella tangerina]|uniref:Zeta-carotene-forming phytoene desaturase n=1 Tax=Parvicella tangerina TaxID=2829795 RepID=A0A916JQJ0_9FLAO|nr:phytoene desaturase family protein [Parvicella tangerina]CAG5086530.1 zeta-carotene-forming phytoene desaturase [Parvicella tangerina]
MKTVDIIGGGYSGLASACYLAKAGHKVRIFEKNESVGGRSRKFEADGFMFDMGPSWYWMPDVFETFFNDFGKKASDYYELVRLSPSYRVFFGENDFVDLPSNLDELYDTFERIEEGSAARLRRFLDDAAYKYRVGINDLVQKPSKSLLEFATFDVVKGVFRLQLFKSFSKYIRQYFNNPKLIQIIEFPVLFLGAKPENIPALYSLMNYADIVGGTWYPMGGMHKVIEGMELLAKELGVEIHTNAPVEKLSIENKRVKSLIANDSEQNSDAVIASADYHFVEQNLLEKAHRKYSEDYWDSRVLAPSCLLYYVGVNKKLKNLLHHNLFFDQDFNLHAREIYDTPKWPSNPLFYVCAPSVTDESVAPKGYENLFLLIPVAPDLPDTEEMRNKYFELIVERLERLTDQKVREHIIYNRSYSLKDFKKDYNAYKGNAYGLANTLKQTAILKPSMHNDKVKNLFYTGQLTVPGPGVPPSLISGKIAAQEAIKYLKTN